MAGRPDRRQGVRRARNEQRLAEEEARVAQGAWCETRDAAIKYSGGGVSRATTGATDGDDAQGWAWCHDQWEAGRDGSRVG